jgi:hypothetical protein
MNLLFVINILLAMMVKEFIIAYIYIYIYLGMLVILKYYGKFI